MTEKSFPSKLFRFLNEAEESNMSHIASWQPHGRSFRIHDPTKFVAICNPRSYTSFQRQLNIYGFHRITNGNDKNGYYHKNFLRGHGHLLHKIHRVPIKKDRPERSTNSSPVPDFYSPPLYDANRTGGAIAGPAAARYPTEMADMNTAATEGRNSGTVSQLVGAINHTNRPLSQMQLNEGVIANSVPFQMHDLINQFTSTAANDANSYNLLQPILHPSFNQYMPGVNAVSSYSRDHQMNNSLIPNTFENQATMPLSLVQHLLPMANNISQVHSHAMTLPSQPAHLADTIDSTANNQIQAMVAMIESEQYISPQVLSLWTSFMTSSIQDTTHITPQTSLDSLSYLLTSTGMLDHLAHLQLLRGNNDRQQAGRGVIQSLPDSSNGVGVPITSDSDQDGRMIESSNHASSDNNDNEGERIPTGQGLNNKIDLNPNPTPQQLSPESTDATNDRLIANALALYRSNS